ncbi:MAG TPA: hypothetical protein VFR81_08355 [Longimicrobium sp.]|nr:hypothetical protein [Longimicrobium sp.]
MRLTRRNRIVLAVILLAACETTARTPAVTEPSYQPLALRTPEMSYRLSAEDRAKVVTGFDVDALERLLRRVRPDMRVEVLRHFQAGVPGERKRGALTEFTEPELNPLLEEVWATMWDDAPDQALDEGWYFYPGREIAKQRREQRRRAEEREGRNQ